MEPTKAQLDARIAAAGQQPVLSPVIPSLPAIPSPAAPYVNPNAAWQNNVQTPAAPLAVPDPRALATQANQEASSIYEATKNQDIDLRESSTIIQKLTENLTKPAPAAPPSLMQMFTDERKKLGLEPLESEMASLDAEIDRINTVGMVGMDKIDDRNISNEARSLRKSQVAKDAQRELAFLQIQKSALARQIDNKMNAVQMTMQFTQQDFANASAAYNTEFSRNMQMLDLFTGLQDREDAKQDKLANNARANLQTITNLVRDSGKSFSDMDEGQQRNIRQWEIQAGLPTGTYEQFAIAKPKAKILHTSTGTNAAGEQIVSFVYDDGTGMPGVVEIVNTGGVVRSISQQASAAGNSFTAQTGDSITSLLGANKVGQGTKTAIGTILGVINASEDLAKARPDGKFSGFYPGSKFVDIFMPDALKKNSTIENEGYLNAINLKVQQWASGATLTESQTKLVEGMVPKKNDSDEKIKAKLNNLTNFMQQQIRGTLQAEGVVYEPTKVDLWAPQKSLADIFNQ